MFRNEDIREQILEIIVRQALAGAPWREICKGPMEVNDISVEEVELNVLYRQRWQSGQDTQITSLERQKLNECLSEWQASARQTVSPERRDAASSHINAINDAVANFYELAGFKRPPVVICESPVQFWLYPVLTQPGGEPSEKAAAKARVETLSNETSARFWTQLERAENAIARQHSAAPHSAALPLVAPHSGAPPDKSVRAAIYARLWNDSYRPLRLAALKHTSQNLAAALRFEIRSGLLRTFEPVRVYMNPMVNNIPRGLFTEEEFGKWNATDVIRNLLPISHLTHEHDDDARLKMVQAWLAVLKLAPAFLCLENACFVCLPPVAISLDDNNRLHRIDGHAAQFTDGYSLYAMRGVILPRDIIEHPEAITVSQIEQTENVEIRMAMIDLYGAGRYLEDSGAVMIHKDESGELFRKEIAQGEPLVMVRVTNATADGNGTYRKFFLRVPPNIQTARAAVAWTFGLAEADYHPAEES